MLSVRHLLFPSRLFLCIFSSPLFFSSLSYPALFFSLFDMFSRLLFPSVAAPLPLYLFSFFFLCHSVPKTFQSSPPPHRNVYWLPFSPSLWTLQPIHIHAQLTFTHTILYKLISKAFARTSPEILHFILINRIYFFIYLLPVIRKTIKESIITLFKTIHFYLTPLGFPPSANVLALIFFRYLFISFFVSLAQFVSHRHAVSSVLLTYCKRMTLVRLLPFLWLDDYNSILSPFLFNILSPFHFPRWSSFPSLSFLILLLSLSTPCQQLPSS